MKNFILVGFLAILLLGLVSAVEETIVETDIRVDFNPTANCTESCTNSTVGNTTTTTCTEICEGILTIQGENLIKKFSIAENEIHETLENNVIRKLGNRSDITSLVAELKNWREIEAQYNKCLDSNRRIAANLTMYEEDYNYKQNYTVCSSNLEDRKDSLENVMEEAEELEKSLEKSESDKLLYGIIGIIIGFVFVKFLLPKLKGEDTQRDDGNKEFPPNSPY